MLENGERGSGEIERHRAATRLWEIAAQRTAKSLTHLIKCNDIQLFAQQNMYNETRNLHAELRETHTESHFHFSFFIFHFSYFRCESRLLQCFAPAATCIYIRTRGH